MGSRGGRPVRPAPALALLLRPSAGRKRPRSEFTKPVPEALQPASGLMRLDWTIPLPAPVPL